MSNKNNRDFNDDARLDGAGQQAVRKIVQALPEEPLSMAWRSSLNEHLLEVAGKQRKKQRWLWAVKPGLGLSLVTAALMVFLIFQPSTRHHTTPSKPGLESAILADHHNSALLTQVSSVGLSENETASDINTQDPGDEVWSEADVESL